jgi:hypothetical protein
MPHPLFSLPPPLTHKMPTRIGYQGRQGGGGTIDPPSPPAAAAASPSTFATCSMHEGGVHCPVCMPLCRMEGVSCPCSWDCFCTNSCVQQGQRQQACPLPQFAQRGDMQMRGSVGMGNCMPPSLPRCKPTPSPSAPPPPAPSCVDSVQMRGRRGGHTYPCPPPPPLPCAPAFVCTSWGQEGQPIPWVGHLPLLLGYMYCHPHVHPPLSPGVPPLAFPLHASWGIGGVVRSHHHLLHWDCAQIACPLCGWQHAQGTCILLY